ncbi:DNA/RNA non-specific endonuclease [Psychrobacter aestuarii]|nr:DNA/RNA non-specific endonuclease [Psychrobacter aestuarii]
MTHALIDHPYRLMLASFTLLCASMLPAHAEGFSACSDAYYSGIYPEFTNTKLAQDTQPLCFDGFAVMYSARSRTPLWSAEHLTRERLTQAKTIDRQDSFHEESRLPRSARASLEDYSGSGYDRGHLAPNADMATRSQQYDSFSLANIAPQSPRNNRYIWRNLEEATRDLTEQYGEVYTVTGVAFLGSELTQLDNRVLVPSHFYKVVYIPALDSAGVYYAPNDESERVEVISLDELEANIGIDVLPILDASRRDDVLALPLKAGEPLGETQVSETPSWMVFVAALLKWLVNQLSA